MSAEQPARDGGEGDVEALAKVLAEHDDPTGWTCDDSDAPVYECLCGDRSPSLSHDYIYPEDAEAAARWHREHMARAILASDWLSARIAAAEQRGREDNADHAMCYVHGSEALAARERRAGAAALREAAVSSNQVSGNMREDDEHGRPATPLGISDSDAVRDGRVPSRGDARRDDVGSDPAGHGDADRSDVPEVPGDARQGLTDAEISELRRRWRKGNFTLTIAAFERILLDRAERLEAGE